MNVFSSEQVSDILDGLFGWNTTKAKTLQDEAIKNCQIVHQKKFSSKFWLSNPVWKQYLKKGQFSSQSWTQNAPKKLSMESYCRFCVAFHLRCHHYKHDPGIFLASSKGLLFYDCRTSYCIISYLIHIKRNRFEYLKRTHSNHTL